MEKLGTIEEIRDWRTHVGEDPLGFVPTMGALHEGHLQLIRAAREENQHTLVSIFVNPTQFNDPRDCSSYPVQLQADLATCQQAGVSAVFLPHIK